MISETPFIFYSLPKSRTTQHLTNGRKIEKAWSKVCDFLNNCTTANPDQPSGIDLTAYSAYEGDAHPEITDKIITEAKLLLGEGKTDPIGYFYPSGLPDQHTKTEWHLDNKDFKKVLDYLTKGQPWPRYTFGPVELTISYDFKLLRPTDRKELGNQELSSNIMIWLSRHCLCSPDIYFPFEQPNLEFYNYLKDIENFLPFKLEQKYLRLGRANKTKTAYIFSKF